MLTGQRYYLTAAVLPFLLHRQIGVGSAVACPSVHLLSRDAAGSRSTTCSRENTRTLAGMSKRIEPGPGQESVWDYPRPPRVEQSSSKIEVELGGKTIATTTRAWRVLETSHPPVRTGKYHKDQLSNCAWPPATRNVLQYLMHGEAVLRCTTYPLRISKWRS